MAHARALVTGGSGAVGREVVRALRASGLAVDFTFLRSEDVARELAAQTGGRAHRVDLRRPDELCALLAELRDDPPSVLVHCAATLSEKPFAAQDEQAWDETQQVNARAAFALAQGLAPSMKAAGGGDIVLVGALDRAQSLPLPPVFAASQGQLAAFAMALAKELGPDQTRVNLVALGPLTAGLSRALPRRLLDDYLAFSALRRLGDPAEVARTIRWLALDNRYLNGKVVALNGGL